MKKTISLILALLVLTCALCGCSSNQTETTETEAVEAEAVETEAVETEAVEAEAEAVEAEPVEAEAVETQTIELGTSGLIMTVPAGFAMGEITAEDTDESQVAYYVSEDTLVDFDVYQWAKAEGETLETVAADEAAEYGAEAVAAEFNGVSCMYYEAVEESDGVEYTTVSYLFENGDFFAEVVFWLDGETAADEVSAMINTIAVVGSGEITKEGTEIVLGTTSLKITTPFVYVAGDITAEDTDENQVAYYASEDSLVDFDVYQWAKAEGETLEAIAAEEAAEYGAEAEALTIGGLTVMKYTAVEESDGVEYETATYITEDGSDFVEIVFWLDGENAEETVTAIIESLTK